MKKNLLFILHLFLLFSTIGVYSQPKMLIEPSDTIDYGIIMENSDGVREVTMKNVGDEPLIITNARGSCGCIIPTYPLVPIEPGDSSILSIKYDTKRIGKFIKFVTLANNDPENMDYKVTIKGEVTVTSSSDSFESIPEILVSAVDNVIHISLQNINRIDSGNRLLVHDLNGKLHYFRIINESKNNLISLDSVVSGIYIITLITNENRIYSKKFVNF